MRRLEFLTAGSAAVMATLLGRAAENRQERAVVFNIEKGATHDGPGIRTVAFLKGCPMRCKWCHSPESWSYAIEKYSNGEVIGREMTSVVLLDEVLKDKDFYEASGGGVTLSVGEPPGLNDYLVELGRIAELANSLTAVGRIDIEPYVPYGADKVRKLGLKVYEAPQSSVGYGKAIVERLSQLTPKDVKVG